MSEVAYCQSLWGKIEVTMGDGRPTVLSGCTSEQLVRSYFACYCSKGDPCDTCYLAKLELKKRNWPSHPTTGDPEMPNESRDMADARKMAEDIERQILNSGDGVPCRGCGSRSLLHVPGCSEVKWLEPFDEEKERLDRVEEQVRTTPAANVERHKEIGVSFVECEQALTRMVRAAGGNEEAVSNTPLRFFRALFEMTSGSMEEPAEILSKQFAVDSDEMIVLRGVEFTSLCEHHLLPFVGTCDVGYLPPETGMVVGLSKLARLVDCFAKRLQLQERMTRQIASALMEHLHARGAAVVVRAKHSCMGCRGVKKPDAEMVTSSMLGLFRTDPVVRQEFLFVCGRG